MPAIAFRVEFRNFSSAVLDAECEHPDTCQLSRRKATKKMRLTVPLPLLALLMALHANAQPAPEKLALAEQFVQLLKINDSVEIYLKDCASPEGSPYDAKSAFRSNPGNFGGVSPQSAYWPEVEAIYARFQRTICAYITPEKFVRFYVEQLAERISEEDMRASIAFNSSPAGRRLQAAVLATNSEFLPYANKLVFKAQELAVDQFRQEMRAVQDKYKNEPQ